MQRRLFVVVPGILRRLGSWDPLLKRLAQDVPNSTFLVHDHQGSVFSRRSIDSFASELAAAIHERFQNEPPDRITLIGHSFGGVLVRMAYLIAGGRNSRAFTAQMKWWQSVDRIILFAAINRGFDPDRMGRTASLAIRLLLIPPVLKLVRGLLKGSDEMTDLRIAWIRHFRDLADAQPVVIQLYGTRDSIVHKGDSADVEQFKSARQVLVAGATHANLYELPKGQEDSRYQFLKEHILETGGSDESRNTDTTTTDVVFLVHGIRASSSQWPDRARRLIEAQYPSVAAVPAGYGFFSALNFAIPFLRRRQIRWMQDEYSFRFAKHPAARMHFVGHSNGTYLLGNTLRRVPSVEFDRVTLVGSVLPESFEWADYIGSRVREVRNHRASRDLPVSILCSFLRGLGMRDVGMAGYHGFMFGDRGTTMREVFYYSGGHGIAMKDDASLSRLIDYTITGQEAPLDLPGDASYALSLLSRGVGVLAWPLLLLIVAALWWISGPVGGFLEALLGSSPDLAKGVSFATLVLVIGAVLKIS